MAVRLIRIGFTGIPLMILLLPKSRMGGLFTVCFYILFCLFLLWKGERKDGKPGPERSVPEICLSIVCGVFFYIRWNSSARILKFASSINLPEKQLCAVLTVILCCGACFSLDYLFSFFPDIKFFSKHETVPDLCMILLTAVVMITLVSTCSPFYPFNDWVDPNTMFTVGKGMLKGMIPYRDLYDQKGPLLHAIHAIGAAVSFDSFLGIWLVEIAACFFYLWIQYRILRVQAGRNVLCMIPLLALLTYIPPAFVKGDSAEEFCLPLLSASVLIAIKALRENRFPGDRNSFWIGVISGCILWIKYSMLGFFAGWFLFFCFFGPSEKKISGLIRMVFFIFCGVAAVSIPVLLYFAGNKAVMDLFEGYFLNNILYYPSFGTASGPFRLGINLWNGILRFKDADPAVLLLLAAGLLWCFVNGERKTGFLVMLMTVTGFVLIFFSGTSFPYYTLIFAALSVFGLMWGRKIRFLKNISPALKMIMPFFICALCCLFISENIHMLSYEKEDYPQYKAGDLIRNLGKNSPTILHYGMLDAGFNMTSGSLPAQRFFCLFPIEVPGMRDEQDRYIEEALTDFVVTCHVPLIETDHYELIETYPGDFTADGGSSQFFLYHRVHEPEIEAEIETE